MERTFTRTFLRRAAITLLLAVSTTATAWAQEEQEPVSYIDASGQTQTCNEYIELRRELFEGDNPMKASEMPGGWYVVTNWNEDEEDNGGIDFDYNCTLFFQGDAHIILCDGATMRVSLSGSCIRSTGSLAIYGQTDGTGTLYASNTHNSGGDAINGQDAVIINGGTINATTAGTEDDSHAIYANYGDMTINGGTVTASAGWQAS